MIGYTKSTTVPSSLKRGVRANTDNCDAYDADPTAYTKGVAKFDISNGIYGTDVVKRRLKADQHDKCGFCEAIFDANVAGDVEHYRPKGAIDTGGGKIYPGYYWVGYAWNNLSYACPDCNEYRKRDRFPLAVEGARARSHHDDLTKEEPLLIDPYGEADPRQHIVFRGEAPIGLTPQGTITIELLALDRTTLGRDRLLYLETLSVLYESVVLLENDVRPDAVDFVARVRAQLAAAVLPNAKFSAAAADHLTACAAGKTYLPT
ncbi:hypothetical protein [Mesorhizobium opportunistum]|uniref:HNH domain-containing protein n=1 Tax=Mesorhizobium opportunistum (strain LMG 24607 / HAMBI 3007 / WSM2075) TaxID=536019 RepID=F7YAT9_MESOW|nr:hypothetical protein [Mesorhizobium opportunistum]AEH89915.1 conserved hypothetical protein [Mesorhizobium opportunistum WSM2075]